MSGPKRRRRTQINPGRLAAGRALLAVERGAHAEDMLASLAPPEGPDRRLAWHLVLGVLRRQGSLDHRLAEVSGRPLRKVDPPARVALRLGLFEQVESRTAPHAAVDQAVELCRHLGGRR
ncbi:MAG: rRNA cytosine-C5-methyltransferase, partial [Deltaproteobacteria bacterium]